MSNLDLAVIIATFAQKLSALIVWAVAYAAGDPRPDKRKNAADKINKIVRSIDESCNEIADLAKCVPNANEVVDG